MALQVCPNCLKRAITWYVDDDNSDRWLCVACRCDLSEEKYMKMKERQEPDEL